jgi:hypothetical protein
MFCYETFVRKISNSSLYCYQVFVMPWMSLNFQLGMQSVRREILEKSILISAIFFLLHTLIWLDAFDAWHGFLTQCFKMKKFH